MNTLTGFMASFCLVLFYLCPFNAISKQSLLHFSFNNPSSPIIIVVDPGHGGKDNGCTGRNQVEKDINLQIAKELEYILERDNPNFEVILTRRTDEFISLKERVRIANDNNSSLFLSIHCNSINIASVSGSETYVAGLDMVHSKQNNHHHEGVEDFSNVSTLPHAEKMVVLKESLDLASNLANAMGHRLPYKNRGVKEAGFTVLKYLRMPGSLVEIGYLSNPIQENYIGSEAGMLEIAHSLNDGILAYLEQTVFEVNRERPLPHANANLESFNHAPHGMIYSVKLEESIDRPILYFEKKWDKLESLQIIKKGNNYIYHTGNYSTLEAAKISIGYLNNIGFNNLSVIEIPMDQ